MFHKNKEFTSQLIKEHQELTGDQFARSATSEPVRRSRAGVRAAAVLTAVAVASGAGIALHEKSGGEQAGQTSVSAEKPDAISISIDQMPNKEAVVAIAERYDCSIAAVTDSQVPPTGENGSFEHNGDRSTVTVTLAASTRPEAIPYLEQYENDNTVSWYGGLKVAAVLQEPGDDHRLDVAQDPRATVLGYRVENNQAQAEFFPKHTYADGTVMTVVSQEKVDTVDADYRYSVYAQQPCGSLVLHDGVWSAAEEIPPLVEQSISQEVSAVAINK